MLCLYAPRIACATAQPEVKEEEKLKRATLYIYSIRCKYLIFYIVNWGGWCQRFSIYTFHFLEKIKNQLESRIRKEREREEEEMKEDHKITNKYSRLKKWQWPINEAWGFRLKDGWFLACLFCSSFFYQRLTSLDSFHLLLFVGINFSFNGFLRVLADVRIHSGIKTKS